MSNSAATHLLVNDRPMEWAGGTVMDLAQELGLAGKKGVALAVNGEVVLRGEWGSRSLGADDRVLVIRATQGG
jgi:sulfur carrier protein